MAKQEIPILYEDSDILIINKPSGVSVTKDRSGSPDIREHLRREHSDAGDLLLVHRLDKDTSGALLIAKNRLAQSFYSRSFAGREVKKVYLAIVTGVPQKDAGYIAAPIAKNDKYQCVRIDTKHGKKAKSWYHVLLGFGALSLLAVMPITGRTHQIRVHLAHKGHPLAIDPLYAKNEPLFLSQFKSNYRPTWRHDEPPLIDRLTLHAYQITIPAGPEKQMRIFTAPLDKKFAAAVKLLAKYAGDNGPQETELVKSLLQAEPLPIDESDISQEQNSEPFED